MSKVNSQTFFNMLGMSVKVGIAFFTIPIFTRLLGTEQFGMYSIYASWVGIVACFMGLNVSNGLGAGYYRFKERYFEFRNSILLEGLFFSVALISIFVFFMEKIERLTDLSKTIILFVLFEALSQFIINFASTAWTFEKKAIYNAIVSIISVTLSAILSVLLIVRVRDTRNELYYLRVIGNISPQVTISILILVAFFWKQKIKIKKEYWAFALKLGLPMIIHLLSHQVLSQSDRFMMRKMGVSLSEIGVYSFFYSFVAILTNILNALNSSWCPFLYFDLEKREYSKIECRVKNYTELFSIITCGFILLSKEIVSIFASNEYLSEYNYIGFFILSTYFLFIYQFPVNYEFYMAETKMIAVGTTVSAIINIALNYILIPNWGGMGAAVATLISYVVLASFHIIVVKTWKLERYPLKMRRVFGGCACVVVCLGLSWILRDNWLPRWGIALILLVYLVRAVARRKTIF